MHQEPSVKQDVWSLIMATLILLDFIAVLPFLVVALLQLVP